MNTETFDRLFSLGFALVAFVLVFVVLSLCGCVRGKQFTEVEGDALPPPRDQAAQYVPGSYPEVERESEEESERKMRALEREMQERKLRGLLNWNK